MAQLTPLQDIRAVGFEWPKFQTIEEACVGDEGHVDLPATLETLRSSLAFCQGQLNQAYNFKVRTGADYSDFTDRFDEYVRSRTKLKIAVAYVTEIVEAVGM